MRFDILATGSKGNAVVIENCILVDCGISFKALKEHYRDLQLVLLTHQHSDHFNRSTIRRLTKERPTLRFGCCEWLVAPLVECGVEKKNIDVYEYDKCYHYMLGRTETTNLWLDIEAFPLFHDVPNCGYKLFMTEYREAINVNDKKLLYATDTSKILTEAKNYDLYLIEANYEDKEVQERIDKQIIEGKDYIHEYKAMRNHLSEKDALNFIAANAGAKSRYVLLHGHREQASNL